jgi:hypothetical protein
MEPEGAAEWAKKNQTKALKPTTKSAQKWLVNEAVLVNFGADGAASG